MEARMSDDKPYDRAELERLWKLTYEDLALAPGDPKGRLKEARFIMQARAARETRQLGIVMACATVVMTIATLVQAVIALIPR
jgi:hypothetical protein